MNINEVIKYPILTEKTYAQIPNNVYAFAVDLRTNRTEVKQAIEFIFQVKVGKVNIVNIGKQPAQLGRSKGFSNKVKKAIIFVKEGKINLYPEDESKKADSKPKPATSEVVKQPQLSAAEQKAQAKIAGARKEAKASASQTKEPQSKAVPERPAMSKGAAAKGSDDENK